MVRNYILDMYNQLEKLMKRIDKINKLQDKLDKEKSKNNKNSSNSLKPLSTIITSKKKEYKIGVNQYFFFWKKLANYNNLCYFIKSEGMIICK